MDGGKIEKRLPAGRGRVADLRPAIPDRTAAAAMALVDGFRRAAHHDVEPIDRKIELLGGDLRERRLGAGAKIDLAGKQRRGVIRMHREPCVEPAGIRRHTARDRARGGFRHRRGRLEQAEGDDEAARKFQQAAAAEAGSKLVHDLAPFERNRRRPVPPIQSADQIPGGARFSPLRNLR